MYRTKALIPGIMWTVQQGGVDLHNGRHFAEYLFNLRFPQRFHVAKRHETRPENPESRSETAWLGHMAEYNRNRRVRRGCVCWPRSATSWPEREALAVLASHVAQHNIQRLRNREQVEREDDYACQHQRGRPPKSGPVAKGKMRDHAGNANRVAHELEHRETRIGDRPARKRWHVPVHDAHDRRRDEAERKHMHKA
jgi:hypothetical protein